MKLFIENCKSASNGFSVQFEFDFHTVQAYFKIFSQFVNISNCTTKMAQKDPQETGILLLAPQD